MFATDNGPPCTCEANRASHEGIWTYKEVNAGMYWRRYKATCACCHRAEQFRIVGAPPTDVRRVVREHFHAQMHNMTMPGDYR